MGVVGFSLFMKEKVIDCLQKVSSLLKEREETL